MKYSILALALITSVIFSPINVHASEAAPIITPQQEQTLLKAYTIAQEDGHSDPVLLQAVIFQETKAGVFRVGPGNCLGVSQLKFSTAKAVLKLHPDLRHKYNVSSSDKELMKQLKTHDELNMSIASRYLLMLAKNGKDTASFKAAAYNRGPGAVKGINTDNLSYVKKVKAFMTYFKRNKVAVPTEVAVADIQDVVNQEQTE